MSPRPVRNIKSRQRTTDYLYDALGRLTREDFDAVAAGLDYETDYTLDLVGNRLAKNTLFENGNVEQILSQYNACDWLLTEETRVNSALTNTTTHGYDQNGSLASQSSTNGDSATYTWSLRNRLSGATVIRGGQTTNASYLYNDEGIRVRTTENGTTRLLLVDSNNPTGYAQVIEEYTPGGILFASFVYGLEPLSQNQSGVVSHYFLDGHSGVRLLLNAVNAIVNRYRYDAYGVTLAGAGTAANPLLYRGERFDPVLAQYYLRARFYDPTTGRFTRLDPFAGRFRVPQSLHKYAYAHADPMNGRNCLAPLFATGTPPHRFFDFSWPSGAAAEAMFC